MFFVVCFGIIVFVFFCVFFLWNDFFFVMFFMWFDFKLILVVLLFVYGIKDIIWGMLGVFVYFFIVLIVLIVFVFNCYFV